MAIPPDFLELAAVMFLPVMALRSFGLVRLGRSPDGITTPV